MKDFLLFRIESIWGPVLVKIMLIIFSDVQINKTGFEMIYTCIYLVLYK